jgi:hypothetical protein
MRRMLAVGTMLGACTLGALAQSAGAAPGVDPLEKLAAANNLELKGNIPYYLAVSFQLFDIDGKPAQAGSFEQWWAAPGSSRIVVHLPGLNEDGRAPDGADVTVLRNVELVSELIEATVRPITGEPQPGERLKQDKRAFGKLTLNCVTQPQGFPGTQQSSEVTICSDPNIDDVRIVLESNEGAATLRNSIGKFHNSYVALDLEISLLGKKAITGKVTTLHGIDPATAGVKLPPSATEPAAPSGGVGHVLAGVAAGRRVRFVEPDYPVGAKLTHMSGKVLLHAIIAKDGSIRSLVPLASTGSMFTLSATDAVKQWKYSPYLLNGEPTEVDTTITVNFALN